MGVAGRCPSGAGTGLTREAAPPRRWGCPGSGQSLGGSGLGGARVRAGEELPPKLRDRPRRRRRPGGECVSVRGKSEPPGLAGSPSPLPRQLKGLQVGGGRGGTRVPARTGLRTGLRTAPWALGSRPSAGRASGGRSPQGGAPRAGGGVSGACAGRVGTSARGFTQELFPARATRGSHLRTRQVGRLGSSAFQEAARLGASGDGGHGQLSAPAGSDTQFCRDTRPSRGSLRGQTSGGRANASTQGGRGGPTWVPRCWYRLG